MQCKKIVADVGHINEKKSVKIKKNMYSKKTLARICLDCKHTLHVLLKCYVALGFYTKHVKCYM